MALSEFSLVTLITFLLGGGGSDLLDYVPTDAYWKAKEVVVTPEVLAATLKPTLVAEVGELVRQLDSPDAAVRETAAAKIRSAGPGAIPALQEETESEIVETARRAKALIQEITADTKPASIRRLMAIRTIGERQEKSALNILRPLLESKEPFVAEYAGRAIARIEGKPFERPRDAKEPFVAEYAGRAIARIEGKPFERPRDADVMKGDLWLLPANCAAVGQFSPRGGLAIPFDQALAPMQIRPEQKEERLQTLTHSVLELADRVGNLRIDGITLGLSGDIGARSGFLVAIIRGQFDRVAFSELVRQQGTPAGNAEGFDVFQPDGESAMFFASDNQAVFMAAPAGTAMPLKEMAAAVKAGKGGLEKASDLAPLIEAADVTQSIWAVARTTPEMRQLAAFGGFDSASLVGKQDGETFELRFVAEGADAKKMEASVQELSSELASAKKWFESNSPVMPPLKPVTQLLRSVSHQLEGKRLTAAATFKGPVTATLVFLEFPYAQAKPEEEDAE
jgi:hypothetical protein